MEDVMHLIDKFKEFLLAAKGNYKVNTKGVSHAESLISSGKVDLTSSWSFTAEDGNKILGRDKDWAEYSKWFLAIGGTDNKESKAYYHFPYGKNGKVYRKGLIAAKQRAAQSKHDNIMKVADKLLKKLDDKYKGSAPIELFCPILFGSKSKQDLLASKKRIFYAVAAVPDVPMNKYVFSEDVIRQMAHRYMIESRATGIAHASWADALKVVESVVLPKSMKIFNYTLPKGSWLLCFKVFSDSLWRMIVENKFGGISIEAMLEIDGR